MVNLFEPKSTAAAAAPNPLNGILALSNLASETLPSFIFADSTALSANFVVVTALSANLSVSIAASATLAVVIALSLILIVPMEELIILLADIVLSAIFPPVIDKLE